MAVTRERFEQGMTYEQYRAQMTRNQERFDANERQLALDPADLAPFKNLPQTLNVLVLAEDWCGDVIDNLPILGRLARESGKLNPRIFLRDQNPDLMDQYLNRGEFHSIPVFAFFDDQFHEIGHFIERPDSVTERRAQRRKEVLAQHPELQEAASMPITQMPEDVRAKYMEITASIRDELKPVDNRDVVQALRQIVERVPAQG